MGLDTRAFIIATPEWRERWVKETNEKGERQGFLGLFVETLTEPVTIDSAPKWHQDDEIMEFDWPEGLAGGLFSGGGPSFRGKAYVGYVEHVTGRSLYEAADAPWEGDTVREIAEKLEAAVDTATTPPDDFDGEPEWWPPKEERRALAAWFRVCADNNLAVSGDY